MFGRKRKQAPEPSALPLPFKEDNVARVAIAEDGQIVYASAQFRALSSVELEQPPRRNARSILSFVKSHSIDTLPSGIHQIRIEGREEALDFHFDWLTTPDQKRYLVGSQAEEKPTPQTTDESGDTPELQKFLDMAHEAMIVTSADGEILRVNQTFHDLLETDNDTVGGTNFISLFQEEDRPFIRNTLQMMSFEAEAVADFEVQMPTQSGRNLHIDWRGQRQNGHVYYVGRDVTSIKSQEAALKKREAQLEEAEQIARMGHWQWVLGQEEISWSDEIYKMFGFAPSEFNPSIDSMTALINRSDLARVNQAFERALIEGNAYDMEFSIKRPDGELRYIHCEGRCAMDDDGDVHALYGIMQDMTERVLYEQELKAAKDSAERAYAAKTTFLANMSHELRTPLNAIIGFSEMIEQQLLGPIGTEKYLEYVKGIRESGGHLLDLISDILDMSKIEAGKYELALEQFNAIKTIRFAAHMMESRAMDDGVKLTLDQISTDDITIIGDRRAFLQVMLNLMSNAVKFTPDGGSVSIECHERETYIAIKVIDTGIGIPANKLANITRPFEQVSTDYAREHEGSGLGLAITKELIEMHGGNMHIESQIDQGTSVTVRMPLDASKATQKNA